MPYLIDEQIKELTSDLLKHKTALINRGKSQSAYILIEPHKHGMQGIVWRAKNDLGEDIALKIIPTNSFEGRSLIDEMTEAGKLNPDYFAKIIFFGELRIEDYNLSCEYKCIATEWIPGEPFDDFVKSNPIRIDEFINLSKQIFTALANLLKKELCHDDLHPGNILVISKTNDLTNEIALSIKIIDTGTIKRKSTRDSLLHELRNKIDALKNAKASKDQIDKFEELLKWKEPDDHLRAVESLLLAANSIARNYSKIDFWERKFFDQLHQFFKHLVETSLDRRLDAPDKVMNELNALSSSSKVEDHKKHFLTTPFDYISAEMIRNDREFNELFSKQCPWLKDCQSIEPIYIYGPRGCGKSSVLRWLSFKTRMSDPKRAEITDFKEIGVYVSCSVELRSRFWLFSKTNIDDLQNQIIRFFNLILLEELFDTLALLWETKKYEICESTFESTNLSNFTEWVIKRLIQKQYSHRLQGQSYFEYLKTFVRKLRWDTWSSLQQNERETGVPDPSLVFDICRMLPEYFEYFKTRHITFLIDDYSNQRIPSYLQKKLNQTISFAKQGTPLFKVTSEYQGVDLEGIQEGREVVEINVGDKYTSLLDNEGYAFLADIVNIRLKKSNYTVKKIEDILGRSSYDGETMPQAICDDRGNRTNNDVEINPFYYHGIDCIHWLCSGDIALALDLIKRIFDNNSIGPDSAPLVSPHSQHHIIQKFAHEEVKRIRYIVPFGEEMHDIICYLGYIARACVMEKRSKRADKKGIPICKTHLDIRVPVILELQKKDNILFDLYEQLTRRAILFSIDTSRSRISLATERLQIKRIYLPAFKAPLKRDVPIKIDNLDNFKSLLSNPKTFSERELKSSDIDVEQLRFAMDISLVKPMH